MSRILTIIILLFTTNLLAQDYGYKPHKVSLKARKQVNILKEYFSFDDEGIGYSGYKSDTYKCFEKLQSLATTKEFIELCKHPSPLIRYYSFYELEKRNVDDDILLPIVKAHLNDTASIFARHGCEGYEEEIGSFMFSFIKNKYLNDKKLRTELDSLFLYSKDPLIFKGVKYLQNLPKNPKHYTRLKKMVKIEKNSQALLPLLDYYNPEDWLYIKYVLDKSDKLSLEAIKRYPKQNFIPYLQEVKQPTSLFLIYDFWNDEWIIENQWEIRSVYSIYLNMEGGVYKKGFNSIIKDNYSPALKVRLSGLIYSMIKDNNEEWTWPVKFELLPYLTTYNKELLDEMANRDSILFYKKVNSIPYRYTKPHYYLDLHRSNYTELELVLRKFSGLNKKEFLKQELKQNINDGFFNYYFEEYSKLNTIDLDSILLNRVTLKKKNSSSYIDEALMKKLRALKSNNSKSKLWYLCYNHINNNTLLFPSSFLKIMDYHFPEKTTEWAFNSLMNSNYKIEIQASLFNYLESNKNEHIQERLLQFYNNQSYSFKTSEFGVFIYKTLHPNEFIYYKHDKLSWL